MMNATIQLGPEASDLSPAYGHGMHKVRSNRRNPTSAPSSTSSRLANNSPHNLAQATAQSADPSPQRLQPPARRNSIRKEGSPGSSRSSVQGVVPSKHRHDDPSNWQLPLSYRKTREEQHVEPELRLLNKTSYLKSLFFGMFGVALAGVPQVFFACGEQASPFTVSNLFSSGGRNISVPRLFFLDAEWANITAAGTQYQVVDKTYEVLVTYFGAIILHLVGWGIYAIAVWRRMFKSWINNQRHYVIAIFQWNAIVISFSEVILARPGFFAAQFFVLLACIFKFSRVGFRCSIACAVGALQWYLLSAVVYGFGLEPVHPVTSGSNLDKYVFLAIAFILCIILTLPAYYERQLTQQDFGVVNEWLDRLNELKANMHVRVRLINTVFPRSVGLRLANQATTYAKSHESSSIMFFKITGLTANPALTQQAAYQHLCNIICLFDDLSVSLGVEKIKAIGHVYMAAAGLPDYDESHATAIADMALACCKHLKAYSKRHKLQLSWKVGIGSGRVVAGVIGSHKLIYDVFGDTVNTASRMYSHCPYGKIQCPENVARLIRNDFVLEPHPQGKIQVKGKGLMRTFFVVKNKIQPIAAAIGSGDEGSDDSEAFSAGDNVREVLAMLDASPFAQNSKGYSGQATVREVSKDDHGQSYNGRMTEGHAPSSHPERQQEVNLLLLSLGLHKLVIDYFMDPFKCSMAQHNRDWFYQAVFHHNLRAMDKGRRGAGNKVTPMDTSAFEQQEEEGLSYGQNIMVAGECGEQLAELTEEYLIQLRGQRSGPFAVQFWWLVFIIAESVLASVLRTGVVPLYRHQFGPVTVELEETFATADDTVMYLQTYFTLPAGLLYTMVLSSDKLPCLTCCSDTAIFWLSCALKILLGVAILTQVTIGGFAYGSAFLLLIFWIASFSYLTHATKTALIVILLALLLMVSVPVSMHFNSQYFNEATLPTVPFVGAIARFSELDAVLFIDVSVIVLLSVTILFSSQSYGHHQRKIFLKHKALSSFYEEKEEIAEMLDDVVAKLPLTVPAIDNFKSQGKIDQILFDTFSTVLFADIVSFTTFSSTVKAAELVKILNSMFIKFDALADEFGIEKIKTIGDCYVAATGIFTDWTKTQEPTVVMVQFAQQMLLAMQQLNAEYDTSLQIRVGIHCGPVIAGIMGKERLAFDLWGPTVEAANEMEAMGKPSKVHLSHSVYQRCCDYFGDVFTEVPRLSREEQSLGMKRPGYEPCIDVAGYVPEVTTTFLIDAVYTSKAHVDDLYNEGLSFSASLASAKPITISRPMSVNHAVHVHVNEDGEFEGLTEEMARSLKKDAKLSQSASPKIRMPGAPSGTRGATNTAIRGSTSPEDFPQVRDEDSPQDNGNSPATPSAGALDADLTRRPNKLILPSLREAANEDSEGEIEDPSAHVDPLSVAVTSDHPIRRSSNHSAAGNSTKSKKRRKKDRKKAQSNIHHSHSSETKRSPVTQVGAEAEARPLKHTRSGRGSTALSRARENARQRASSAARLRAVEDRQRNGSIGETIDLSAPQKESDFIGSPLTVASNRSSGRSSGHILRSETLELTETKITSRSPSKNRLHKSSRQSLLETKLREAKMRGSFE